MRFMYDRVIEVLSDILISTIVLLMLCSHVSLQLFKEAESSILEIMKVDVVSFIYIPMQV